jgi:hypothetical protein
LKVKLESSQSGKVFFLSVLVRRSILSPLELVKFPGKFPGIMTRALENSSRQDKIRIE